MNISVVSLLSNGSIWIPLHKRIHNNERYFINGSSVLLLPRLQDRLHWNWDTCVYDSEDVTTSDINIHWLWNIHDIFNFSPVCIHCKIGTKWFFFKNNRTPHSLHWECLIMTGVLNAIGVVRDFVYSFKTRREMFTVLSCILSVAAPKINLKIPIFSFGLVFKLKTLMRQP